MGRRVLQRSGRPVKYITKLPKAVHEAASTSPRIESLVLVAHRRCSRGLAPITWRMSTIRKLKLATCRRARGGISQEKTAGSPGGSVLSVTQMECGGGCNRGRASFGLGATALNYLEVPSPIRRRLSRNGKSKRGIHNLGSGR
jgi:hypothetical protein